REQAHEVVLERDVEAARSRVALAAGAAAELVVDAPRLVPLGADDVEAAGGDDLLVVPLRLVADPLDLRDDAFRQPLELAGPLPGLVHAAEHDRLDEQLGVGVVALEALALEVLARQPHGVAAEHDVGAAAGDVRRDGDGPAAPGLRDDLGLTAVELRVEHLVRYASTLEHLRQALGGLDRDRADEDRAAGLVHLDGLLDDRLVLPVLRAVDDGLVVLPLDGPVRGDDEDVGAVDLLELLLLGLGRARHAGDLVVELEEVLVRDRRERLVLALDLHALLGLDGLVQALAEAPAGHEAAREL